VVFTKLLTISILEGVGFLSTKVKISLINLVKRTHPCLKNDCEIIVKSFVNITPALTNNNRLSNEGTDTLAY
jgi:hypothetical protein